MRSEVLSLTKKVRTMYQVCAICPARGNCAPVTGPKCGEHTSWMLVLVMVAVVQEVYDPIRI